MFSEYIISQDSESIIRTVQRSLEDDVMQVPSLIIQLKQSTIQTKTLSEICRRLLPSMAKYRGVLDSSEADLREIYSECLQGLGHYSEAADQLAQADAFSSSCQRLLQIADLYLEAGDSVSAETFIHKAGYKLAEGGNPVLKLRHTLAYARVLDSKLRPLEALHKYLEIVRNPDVALEDKTIIARKAIVCAATTGNHRLTGNLRNALKHELRYLRNTGLELFAAKILHGEYIEDISDVLPLLESHHLATTANGKTVFTNALIEHNVQAIARNSETVATHELASKLNIPETEVFETVMKMASDEKINALIDQENGTIYFPVLEVSENDRIRAFCERVEAAEKKVIQLFKSAK